jgi:hypothetical protein
MRGIHVQVCDRDEKQTLGIFHIGYFVIKQLHSSVLRLPLDRLHSLNLVRSLCILIQKGGRCGRNFSDSTLFLILYEPIGVWSYKDGSFTGTQTRHPVVGSFILPSWHGLSCIMCNIWGPYETVTVFTENLPSSVLVY